MFLVYLHSISIQKEMDTISVHLFKIKIFY